MVCSLVSPGPCLGFLVPALGMQVCAGWVRMVLSTTTSADPADP